jgi:hypothetical protein
MTYLITVSKVHPITCHEDMEVSQLYLSVTPELERGLVVNTMPWPPSPWERIGTYCKGGWIEHVQKISPQTGHEPPTAQPIVCRYTSYATAAYTIMVSSQKKERPEWVNIYESKTANSELVKPT